MNINENKTGQWHRYEPKNLPRKGAVEFLTASIVERPFDSRILKVEWPIPGTDLALVNDAISSWALQGKTVVC